MTSQRTVGEVFGVSIGTAIALECLFGLNKDKPPDKKSSLPFTRYDGLCINLNTLARNYISSFPSKDVHAIEFGVHLQQFMYEIISINNIVEENSGKKIIVSFYRHDYSKINRVLKAPNYKTKFTNKQYLNLNLEETLVDSILKQNLSNHGIRVEITKDTITHGRRKNLFITHKPVDLLLTTLNPDLLESHTGTIKSPFMFSTKLKRGGDDVPFNRFTIQIYGDSSGMLLPYDSKIINQCNEFIKEKGVSRITSEEKFYKLTRKYKTNEFTRLMSVLK